MLKVQNLTAGYGALTVLNDVSLLLPTGARLGVFGHNGAGKTTLLRCIVGAVRPRRGKVDVAGA
jgi:branched-chain amino acid transport system ATP-binding protein